jgi:hypothetical protein
MGEHEVRDVGGGGADAAGGGALEHWERLIVQDAILEYSQQGECLPARKHHERTCRVWEIGEAEDGDAEDDNDEVDNPNRNLAEGQERKEGRSSAGDQPWCRRRGMRGWRTNLNAA